jgi:hypothetical protein
MGMNKHRFLQFLGDAVYTSEPPYRGEDLRFLLIHGPDSTMEDYGLSDENIDLVMGLDKSIPNRMIEELKHSGVLAGSKDGLPGPNRSLIQFFGDLAFETEPPMRGPELRRALADKDDEALLLYGLSREDIDVLESGSEKAVIERIRDALPGNHWVSSITTMMPWPGAQVCVHKVFQGPGAPGPTLFYVSGLGFQRDPVRLVAQFQQGKIKTEGRVLYVNTNPDLEQIVTVVAELPDPGKYCVAIGDRQNQEWSSAYFDYKA